jgi:mRNA-degrading endonuclease RelE of RelBE toxin-antitoxin system
VTEAPVISRDAAKQLKKLRKDKAALAVLRGMISSIASGTQSVSQVKPLRGMKGVNRLRSGDYRVVYNAKTREILGAGRRKDIYRQMKIAYLDMNASSPDVRMDTFRTDARGVGRLMSYIGDMMQRDDPGGKRRPIPYMPEKRPHAMKVSSMKQKPEDVGYDAMGGTAERRCGNCANFVEPNGCLLVEGAIESGAYCDLYEADGYKTAADIIRTSMATKLASIFSHLAPHLPRTYGIDLQRSAGQAKQVAGLRGGIKNQVAKNLKKKMQDKMWDRASEQASRIKEVVDAREEARSAVSASAKKIKKKAKELAAAKQPMSKVSSLLEGKTPRQMHNLVKSWVKGEDRRKTYLNALRSTRHPALMREYVRAIGRKFAPADIRKNISDLGAEKHLSRPTSWVRAYESKVAKFPKRAGAKPPSDPMYDKCWKGYKKVPGKKRGEKGSCEKVGFQFKKKHKNPKGGLSEAGRRAYNKATGGNLKRPQPEGGSRRDSFCARMKGMKKKLTSKETANDPNSRINKSLRKWNC